MTLITAAADPTRTEWGSLLKDEENKEVHFGPAEMADKVRRGDLLDVERTLRPENPKYPGKNAWKITRWKIAGTTVQQPGQQQLPISNGNTAPRPPSYRQQAHPADAKQMWINGLGQQWMAAYAQLLSVTTDGKMKDMDPDTVERAMRVIQTVGDRMFGPTMTTQRKSAPPEVDDMNDDLVPF